MSVCLSVPSVSLLNRLFISLFVYLFTYVCLFLICQLLYANGQFALVCEGTPLLVTWLWEDQLGNFLCGVFILKYSSSPTSPAFSAQAHSSALVIYSSILYVQEVLTHFILLCSIYVTPVQGVGRVLVVVLRISFSMTPFVIIVM